MNALNDFMRDFARKKSIPRKNQVAAIAPLRTIGKKEAHERLKDTT